MTAMTPWIASIPDRWVSDCLKLDGTRADAPLLPDVRGIRSSSVALGTPIPTRRHPKTWRGAKGHLPCCHGSVTSSSATVAVEERSGEWYGTTGTTRQPFVPT
jgi:hypothetical protein